ncbi:hypothetical protein [Duganella radicis]|uniref:Transporter substrate-binding domain-containing protein n=1 Tax=Duganella radicis TaxID=551988 RepID=A0A6L6PTL8_9BURK|nr:hypothetical protein [Duganella radicis]MTV41585.1 hypothetical protein [Duganella radicis]
MKKYLVLLAMLCGTLRAETIFVYTSAQVAPLVLADGTGIYPDMVAWLNRQKPGDLQFKLIYLPRKRLQLKAESGQLDGIIIGMMPHWFDDGAQKKYLWTAPFALDRYMVALPARQTERRFLVPHNLAPVYDRIAPVLRKVRDDPEWQRLMLRYE